MSPSRTQPSAQGLYRRPAPAAGVTAGAVVVPGAPGAPGTVTSPVSTVPRQQQTQHQSVSPQHQSVSPLSPRHPAPLPPPTTHHPHLQQTPSQTPSHYDKHQRLEGPGTPLGNPVSIALDARKLSPSGNVQVQTSPPTIAGAAPTSASSSAAPSASGTPNATPTRRRTQGLRSPLVKRPPGAPVTMQGWLHKQGSDGLMLWRKRWFVLCDYCLFYYKGPEEEKLLGSILLPSYTISAETNSGVGVGVGVGRGGIGRKFAFKAEHANMRTYYFAADSLALMLQWKHALSLASLVLDKSSYDDSRLINYNSNVVNNQNINIEDNESGFATYRPRQQPTYGHQIQPQSPHQQQLSLNFHQKQLIQQQQQMQQQQQLHQQHGMTNGWRPMGMDPRQHPQHLYANAPPKPRRMANEDNPADSSSPEWSSPDGPPMSPLSHFQQTERRTPDTYGRSLAATPAPPSGSVPPPGPAPGLPQITRAEDYEDVFNERAWVNQRDRPGQLAYLQTSSKTRATIITESLQTTYHRQQKRPRSADFLDYDARRYGVQSPDRDIAGHLDQPSYQLPSVPSSHTLGRLQPQPQTAQPQQPARPKSSLDTSFWSEESYAQEMRETAYLLQARSPQSNTPLLPMSQSVQQFQQHQQQQQLKLLEEQDLLLQRRWSEYADLRTEERSGPGERSVPGDRDGTQPFLRSASARLPRRYRGPDDDSDDDRDGRGSSGSSVHYQQRRNSASGDRKVQQQREESMKRLLEWKQRMLQSPLSRKPSGSSNRGVNAVQNQLSHFYRQQVLRELATQEARAKEIAERDAEALAQAEQENTRIQLQNTTLEDRTNSTDSWNVDNHIPRSRNVATNRAMQLDVARNSRKKLQDDLGRPALRSRSQEGRKSSNSSRFNSYSSDDEVSSLVGRDPVGEEDPLINGGIVGPRTPLLPLQPLCSSQPALPPPSSDSRDSGQISRSSTVDLLSGVVDLSNNNNSSSNNLVNGSLSPTSEDWRNRDFRDSWQARNQNKRRGGSPPSTCGSGGEPFSLQVSAGELLGRTHEELVLLLIQLRRASAAVCKAMETCHVEIEAQARLAELETPRRVEHLHKLDDLKRQLQELEKQYEKGKPLVNLVDNMVKLGSLYREGVSPYSVGLHSPSTPNLDPLPLRQRLEFNQKVQEQRLLAEERRDWDRLSLDHSQLQAKVQHLYRLDQLMREESGTLQSLQQDKELLERALGGLRHKLQAAHTRPTEAEQYRKQQRLLERELSRVRLLLAHNSKKLEETVAENARLEQELVILRQKLQASRQPYYSASACVSPATSMLGGFHDSPPSPATPTTPTAVLEAELRRVQRLVGDLQRQRQELSLAVRQLTEKSNTLSEQIRPGPTGVAGAGPILGRKRQQSSWLETDLDSLVTRDLGTESQQSSPTEGQLTSTPLYVNTELALSPTTNGVNSTETTFNSTETTFNSSTSSDPLAYAQIELSEADDRMKRFYGIIPREKQQEIKTVRIVKRESERRQRDRDRSGNVGIPLLGTTGTKRIGLSDEYLDSTLLGQVLESEEAPLRQTTSSQALDEAMARLDDELHSAIGSTSSSLGPPRSMSLPRGFGKTNSAGLEVDAIPSLTTSLRSASPRIDSGAAMRNAMLRKQRVRFDPTAGSGSESSTGSPSANRALSAREQLFGSGVDDHTLLAIGSRDPSPQLSPVYSNHSVYQSEVARQIVMEMKGTTTPMSKLSSSQLLHSKSQDLEQKEEEKDKENQESSSQENGLSPEQPQGAVRRAVPREKRRHHTVSSSRPLSHTPSSAFPSMGYARSRDDLDMERALRPRLNAPDVVRSTLSRRTPRYDADTIDSLLGTPGKIHIPERYVPENEPALSREEQLQRIRKADAIRKMLTETRSSTTLPTKSPGEEEDEEEEPSSTLKKKMEEDKKQREHLLQLNQILAKQVMEKSKIVAGSTCHTSNHD